MASSGDKTSVASRTSGVQELIERLRDDGVAQGRNEAASLIATARAEATDILDAARREAEQILAAAREDADKLRRNAEDALRLASRDAVIALNEALRSDFTGKIRRLVAHTMQDRAFLEKLILEIARRSVPEEAGTVEILLPDDLLSFEDLQKEPQALAQDSLARFVLEISGDVFRQGLSFAPADDSRPGVRVRLKDDDVEIDLTEEAVTELLMEHLSPRFRALVEQP